MATQDGDFVTAEGLAGALGTVGACDVLYEYGGDYVSHVSLDFTNPPEYKFLVVSYGSHAGSIETAVVPLSYLSKQNASDGTPMGNIEGISQLNLSVDNGDTGECHLTIALENASAIFAIYGIK